MDTCNPVMSVSNPLVTPIHNGTICVNMLIFLQNGCMCALKDIVDVKVLLGESYQHHIIPVLSNSAENSM